MAQFHLLRRRKNCFLYRKVNDSCVSSKCHVAISNVHSEVSSRVSSVSEHRSSVNHIRLSPTAANPISLNFRRRRRRELLLNISTSVPSFIPRVHSCCFCCWWLEWMCGCLARCLSANVRLIWLKLASCPTCPYTTAEATARSSVRQNSRSNAAAAASFPTLKSSIPSPVINLSDARVAHRSTTQLRAS